MNYPQQSAQGLASLGRGNDSMLVHMTPREVQGLQGLAMAHGGSLTVNPQTGLPEAGFLDFVLPVAGSFFGIPPEFTAALMAGKTLIEGGDIGSAALSAFGGYTGGKLGKSLKSFVDPIQSLPTSAVNAAANTANTAGSFVGSTGEMGSKLLSPSGGASQIGSNFGAGAGQAADSLKSSFAPGFADNNIQGSFMGKDVGAQGMFQPGGANTLQTTGAPTYGANVGAGTDIGSTISQGASDFGNQFGAAVKNPIDFARHVGEGDALMGGAQIGMYAAKPIVENMMKPQTFTYTDPDKDKYRSSTGGLSLNDKFDSRLRLVAEGGYIDGYATGGTIQSGGIRDLYGTPDNQPTISPGLSGFGLGRLNNLASEQAMTQAQTLGYADGGDVGMNLDKQRALNLDLGPSLNVETGRQNYTTPESFFHDFYTGNMPQFDLAGPPGQAFGYVMKAKLNDGSTIGQNLYDQMMKSRTRMAKGGYLDGAGDGMSDSIPATIEGKQPARLADGEFVVPADVVSHIGNGSSKAGSKRLYAMLDKVRHARTGTKKQGKQIKAEKYLPA